MSLWRARLRRRSAAASPRPQLVPLSWWPWPALPSRPPTTGPAPPSLPARCRSPSLSPRSPSSARSSPSRCPATVSAGCCWPPQPLRALAQHSPKPVSPDGRLPGPRWRWLAWCTAAAVTFLFLGNVLSPHAQQDRLAHWQSPLGLPGRYGHIADLLSAAGVLLAAAAAAGAVAGLITRWRRGGPLVRQQLLLLALAACPPALLLVAVILTGSVPGWLFGAVLLPLPVAIAIAILSHGLYDLRRAAHHTLLWLTMSGTVVGIYAVVVITAATLTPGHRSWWPSALAAAIAALLLIPLRETLQRAVTRVVYGRWHEPYEVLADLGERLEAAADIDRLLDAAVTELTTGLDLRDVSVRSLDGTSVAGATTGTGTTIALQAYGTTVGCLTYQPPDRQLSAAEQRLLRDLARQLGGALHARLLREDLQRARERLVLAREEERRRLRRDLHD